MWTDIAGRLVGSTRARERDECFRLRREKPASLEDMNAGPSGSCGRSNYVLIFPKKRLPGCSCGRVGREEFWSESSLQDAVLWRHHPYRLLSSLWIGILTAWRRSGAWSVVGELKDERCVDGSPIENCHATFVIKAKATYTHPWAFGE